MQDEIYFQNGYVLKILCLHEIKIQIARFSLALSTQNLVNILLTGTYMTSYIDDAGADVTLHVVSFVLSPCL